MCGRAYSTYTDEELLFHYLNRKPVTGKDLPFKPNFNMSPTHDAPIVRAVDGTRTIDTMNWGLIPEWSPEFKMKFSTINARSEDVFGKAMYKKSILARRCIVPLSGFFEWRREGESKRPFKIFLKDSPIMSVAGVWTAWREGTPEERRSFSILTTAANEFMANIHDRMPVILGAKDYEEWLDPEIHEQEQIAKLMRPCAAELLACTEVSKLVNSPKNNRPEVLAPVNTDTLF